MNGAADQTEAAWLRYAREAARLSLAAMAQRVPYSKSALSYYETGQRNITPDVVAAYERVCGQAMSDPVTVMERLGRADVDRRSFLRGAVFSAALTATALVNAREPVARLIAVTEDSTIGMGEVHALHTVTDALVSFDEVRGGGSGRTAVAEFLSTDVATLLRSRFADSAVRSAAYSAASELAYLAGWKAHDAKADAVAQRWFLSALALAREGGIDGQIGFCYRILALHAAAAGHPRLAPQLAQAGADAARGLDGDARSLFSVALARASAESGDRVTALAALRAADPWMTPHITTDLPRYVRLYCPNKASGVRQAAKSFAALGDWRNTEQHLLLSAECWDRTTHPRIHWLSVAEAGMARWRLGRHADAETLWRAAIPTLTTVQSGRAQSMLAKIRTVAPTLLLS
ncbi:transcriptional regulator with XRE-family HTH domain [Nocardia sp. GAS34]|uniref:helix-turn-helix domain-containing protein n=1 Tax=unclassified Nocardia TaxID=2637762 RepID=UPI003D1B4891